MTQPRHLVPDQCYFVTRRCTQRYYLLRPDDRTNQIFRYCLAEASRRFGIRVVAWAAMSNHYHAVFHDPNAVLPAFLAHLHKMLAKALNARWGRWENLWATEQTCIVRLIEPDDVIAKVVYVLANPVAAHLVDRVFDWPGETAARHLDGRPLRVERPATFFCKHGSMPRRLALVAAMPPTWTAGRDAWQARVWSAVQAREHAVRETRIKDCIPLAGRRNVLNASHLDKPSSYEPRRRLRPAIACARRDVRLRALAELRGFRLAYAAARALVAAHRRAVFPAGTYSLRLLGVPCEPFPAPSTQS